MKIIKEINFMNIKPTDKTEETIERIIECDKVKEINKLNDLLYYTQDDIYNCLGINEVNEDDIYIGW